MHCLHFIFRSVLTWLFAFSLVGGAAFAAGWQWMSPRTAGVSDSCYGRDRFIAVGGYGLIMWSSNGDQWYSVTSPVSGTYAQLRGVCFGNGMYVAVGNSGTILRSADGENWQSCISPTAQTLSDVSFGNGKFVAVGEGPTILVSTDAVTWNVTGYNESSGWPYPLSALDAVQYGNGIWVALERSQTGGIRSVDGIQWDRIYTGSGYDKCLTFDGGRFVAVSTGGSQSQISTSIDGKIWTNATPPRPLYGIAFGEGRYVVVGEGGVVYASTDLATWITVANAPGLGTVCYGNGIFAGAGSGRAFSEDGVNWTVKTVGGASTDLNATCYFKGLHLAAGDSGYLAYYSFDPEGFVQVTSGTTSQLSDMACSSSAAVAVGKGGVALRSTNGISWAQVDAKTGSNLNKVIYAMGRFCAVGDTGVITTSLDGLVWTRVTSNTTENLVSITCSDSTAVIGTSFRNLLLSSNLLTWVMQPGPSEVLGDLAFGNGVYVGIGSYGTVWYSTDGLAWQARSSGHVGWVTRITFGGGQFVLATESGFLRTSADGIIWGPAPTPLENWGRVNALSFNGERFFGVGDFRAVVYSQRRLELRDLQISAQRGPDGTISLYAKAPVASGAIFDLEGSDDLSSWEVVAKGQSPRATGWLYGEPVSSSTARRFFRVQNAP